MTPSPFLKRIVLHNYKSIAACDVRLGALTYLVGPNGAGKSNFLEALQLVADALNTSLASAVNSRWGLAHLLHRNVDVANYLGIRLEFSLPDGMRGHYAFTLEPVESVSYRVSDEECYCGENHFKVKNGKMLASTVPPAPAALDDRLMLVSMSGWPAFRAVFDAIASIKVYNVSPQLMRAQQHQHEGHSLLENGENIAGVLGYLRQSHAAEMTLIEEYLRIIVPNVHGVERSPLGPFETVVFNQASSGEADNQFYASSMSDGTLRALGVLTALFQQNDRRTPRLVALEEPETALHPAAFSAMREAMKRAAGHRQVIVVSHSPDLLDDMTLEASDILAVSTENGATRIATLDNGSREAIKTRLFSAGELLRMGQLAPEFAAPLAAQDSSALFGAVLP
jgi:predicted ATPase